MSLLPILVFGLVLFGFGCSHYDGKAIVSQAETLDQAKAFLGSARSNACEVACSKIALDSVIGVLFAASEIENNYAAQQGELVPACRVEPATAADVSYIIGVLKETKCQFSVRSGGHATWPGASNSNGGVTINLQHLNDIEVSTDRKSVRLGPGALYKDVYATIEPQDLLVVGARMATIGAGGFILGGGISHVSHRHGLAIDSVISFQLVLANGTIARVDSTNHPALFRALRGAGFTNYGIVTSFEMETVVPQSAAGFWTQVSVSSWDEASIVTELHHSHVADHDLDDLDAHQVLIYNYNAQADMFTVMVLQYHGSHADAQTLPEVFKSTQEIKTLAPAESSIMSYTDLITFAAKYGPPFGKRAHWATTSYRPSKEADAELLPLYKNFLHKTKHIAGLAAAVNTQPFYRNFFKMTSKRGGSPLGLDNEEGPLHNVAISVNWENAEDDEFVYGKSRELIEAVEVVTQKHGVYHPYKYVNYAADWQEQAVWEGYGQENLKNLRSLQRQYDPDRIFTKGGLAGTYFKLNTKEDEFDEDFSARIRSWWERKKDEL